MDLNGIMIGLWIIFFMIFVMLTYYVRGLKETDPVGMDSGRTSLVSIIQFFVYSSLIVISLLGVALLFVILKGTLYESHLKEWMNLTIRLMHITFGIAWIGASFYFVFLENALNRTDNVRDELAGNLWAIHGGGFYFLEKFKLAPKKMPKELHWFKFEAYFTWLTGFFLLIVVYYIDAKSYLIDPKVLDITPELGIVLGVGSLVLGYLFYDILCKKFSDRMTVFLVLGTVVLIAFAWFYAHVFSGRAAYIHFGALLGTIMAANVFFVIIPSQKAMVEAAKGGMAPDPADAKAAGMRSRHNNYFTFPVLFVMISNHFPSTFGNEMQWIVLIAVSLGLAGIKHYLNLREQNQVSFFILPASVIILFAVAFYTVPQSKVSQCHEEIMFTEVTTIVNKRCLSCHSDQPTDNIWQVAPKGVVFDTPEQVANQKDAIFQQVVVSQAMPFNNNQSGLTDAERDAIACWIYQGGNN